MDYIKSLPTMDKRCGTYAGYVAHQRRKEIPCDSCAQACREYNRTLSKPRTLPPVIRDKCGTSAGYKAHEKRGEFTCHPCRIAINEVVRLRNQKIKELRARKSREYRANNPDYVRAIEKAHREANPEKKRAKDLKRYARKKGAGILETITVADVLERWGSLCHICGIAIDLSLPRHAKDNKWGLHLDHVIPLAKGGNHTLENVRPAHGFCNLSKGDR